MQIKKDHWYWVRYKYAANTLTVAQPGMIREGKAQEWWLPFAQNAIRPHKGDELEILQEIPFPQSAFPRSPK